MTADLEMYDEDDPPEDDGEPDPDEERDLWLDRMADWADELRAEARKGG